MDIVLAETRIQFQPWRPEMGQVFESTFAFDSETTLIDDDRPWLTPAYVLGAASDGKVGYFIRREHAGAFFRAHRGLRLVAHNAPFDLAVLDELDPELDIYDWVDSHRAWDTQILHRLYCIASEGHAAWGKGQATLEHCVEQYLGLRLPKQLTDSEGDDVRTSYGKWLNRPPNEIEPIYLEYLAKDVLATYRLFGELRSQIRDLLQNSSDVWGFVSRDWLQDQIHRWGWLTHHIQLKAAIVLDKITANGLTIDRGRRDELAAQLDQVADEQLAILQRYGYLPGQKGSGKALQSILQQIDREHAELQLQRTAKSGQYATSEEALSELAGHEFVDALLEYNAVQKLRSTFVEKMGRSVLHPSFKPLVVTGRTSSFGEINAQNLPRDDRVRSCFVPGEGHTFLVADYKTLELATLAQACLRQFDLPSEMAEAINAGKDLHRLVASAFADKQEDDVTKDERQKAKPINFGKPGAMGNRTLKLYAKSSYGVDLSDEEVEELAASWFQLFPEMEEYLSHDDSLARDVAATFNLTPTTYYEHTGDRRFLNHPENLDREDQPHPILGAMCLKALKQESPETQSGRAYSPEEIDYFFAQATHNIDDAGDACIIPQELHTDVRNQVPSVKLQQAVMRQLGRAPVFTLTGRLRANATYAARHNTVFQGLAADGAKLALWRLWRAGYRLVNFIHDEVVVEVPAQSDLTEHAETVRRLMIETMREVVPDVSIDVEYAACDRWSKEAEAVFDVEGNLCIWKPHEEESPPLPIPTTSNLESERSNSMDRTSGPCPANTAKNPSPNTDRSASMNRVNESQPTQGTGNHDRAPNRDRRSSMEMKLNQVHNQVCREGLAEIPDGSVHLAFADPPFNIDYDYDKYVDRMTPEEYQQWCREWIAELHRVLKPDGSFWLHIGDEYASELDVIAKQLGFHKRNTVIWYVTFGTHCKTKFTRSHTHLYYYVKDPKHFTFNDEAIRVPSARQLVYNDKRANPKGRVPDDTWILRPQDIPHCFPSNEDTWYAPRVNGTSQERAGFHGCQMSERILERIIRTSSNPGDIVLDPFAGSGTTLAVAKKLERQFIGFELSPEYTRGIRNRLDGIQPGDPLEGPENPLTSAPSTNNGKQTKKRSRKSKQESRQTAG